MPVVAQRPPRRARPLAIALACLAVLAPSPAHALLASLSAQAPAGWTGPVVPRNAGDATEASALVPSQLLPTQPTYFNWSIWQNPAVLGTWHDEFYIDGQLVQLVTRSNSAFASRWWLELNTGPIFVPGGRHTLKVYIDRLWQSNEDFLYRYDNDRDYQFVWEPQALAPGSVAATQPPEGEGGWANCNAFAFTRAPGTAWVASAGVSGSAEKVEVRVFDDYASSTHGLTNEIARSDRAGGLTNFVVGSAAGSAATLYPAVLRDPGTPVLQAKIAVADAAGRQSASGIASWSSVNLPAGMAAQVFEADFVAGTAESITLTRFLGTSDLEVLVYRPEVAVASRAQAFITSVPRDGDDEYDDLAFAPYPSGRYLIVVARVDQSHLDEACGYSLALATGGTVDAPPTPTAAPLRAAPSPAAGPMQLSFTLAAPSHVALALYDVTGRRARTLEDGVLPAGPNALTWDGRDDRGEAVAPGRYWARLTAGSRVESLGVLRIR